MTDPSRRVVFLGMAGAFSLPPLQALLEAGFDVPAVVLPAIGGEAIRRREPPTPIAGSLPLAPPVVSPNIVRLAWDRGIPVYEVAQLASDEAINIIGALAPDFIVVACFPTLVPRRFRDLARVSALNIHPSLLPANRGPEPIFWTFRLGERRTGVTVHLLADRADAGPIVEQEPLDVPDGISGDQLERRCAELGGRLLVRAIAHLSDGNVKPRPQDEQQASYHPAPKPADFVVPLDRPARWAYNFIRGVGYLGRPLRLSLGGREFTIQEAPAFDPDANLGGEPSRLDGQRLTVQCQPGVLTVRTI